MCDSVSIARSCFLCVRVSVCVYVCVALQTACNRPQKAGQPVPTVCFCRHCSCNPANNSLIFLYHFLDFKIQNICSFSPRVV